MASSWLTSDSDSDSDSQKTKMDYLYRSNIKLINMDTNEFELLNQLLTESREQGERLARVEEQLKAIVGNGGPGKLTNLEDRISKLENFKTKVGVYTHLISAAIGAISAAAAHILLHTFFPFIKLWNVT